MARDQFSGIKTKKTIPNGIRLTFFATLKNIDRAAEEIKNFFTSMGVRKKTFNIDLCIREALINAVTHGSGRDGNKIINLELKLHGKNVIIEIADEGEGFDWKAYLDRGIPSREESGRGLPIMKRYFERIEYNEKGNRLTLKGYI